MPVPSSVVPREWMKFPDYRPHQQPAHVSDPAVLPMGWTQRHVPLLLPPAFPSPDVPDTLPQTFAPYCSPAPCSCRVQHHGPTLRAVCPESYQTHHQRNAAVEEDTFHPLLAVEKETSWNRTSIPTRDWVHFCTARNRPPGVVDNDAAAGSLVVVEQVMKLDLHPCLVDCCVRLGQQDLAAVDATDDADQGQVRANSVAVDASTHRLAEELLVVCVDAHSTPLYRTVIYGPSVLPQVLEDACYYHCCSSLPCCCW